MVIKKQKRAGLAMKIVSVTFRKSRRMGEKTAIIKTKQRIEIELKREKQ